MISPRLQQRVATPGEFRSVPRPAETLGDDDVRVWLAEPEAWRAPEHCQQALALLSEGERDRWRRFRFDEDRTAFLVAHALLRVALSRHAPVSAEEWTFRVDGYGQPSIEAPAWPLRFSLTHTRDLVACAVTRRRPVGIDVEVAARPAPMEVAERYFAPGERRDIEATAPSGRARLFFEFWTLKEAYAKARGLGFHLPFDRFEFRRDPGQAWRVIALDPGPSEDPASWWFHGWSTPTHQSALALQTS
jgi:4'-phosphopantetheinyl transferase